MVRYTCDTPPPPKKRGGGGKDMENLSVEGDKHHSLN